MIPSLALRYWRSQVARAMLQDGQRLVQAMLDAPVAPHRAPDQPGVGGQAAQVVPAMVLSDRAVAGGAPRRAVDGRR